MTGKPTLQLPSDYADWLANLKQRIQGARQRALLSANAEQIRLYHEIGRDILERQGREGWGAKVIDRLSSDLRASFPGMKGLSSRNLKYMKVFAEHCPDRQFVQQSAAQLSPSDPTSPQTADQLPWFHIVILLTKLSDPALREWYAREAIRQMAHLLEPTHSDRFIAILDEHYSSWREARGELNALPLAAEVWKD